MNAAFKGFKKEDIIKCLPNRYPYNQLLLTGKISAKTRTWKWKHEGLTLLYTSKRKDNEIIEMHNLPFKFESGVIVGYGYLQPVRLNTNKERAQIKKEFGNGKHVSTGADSYRYEFKNLKRFKKPIPFISPPGAVSVINVPFSVIQPYL